MSVLSTPVTNPVDALLDEFKRLASRRDVAAGLPHVVGRLPVLLGIDRAVVYRYNAVNKRLVVTHETRGATPSLLGSMHPLAQLPACMVNALETGLQVAIEDFDRYPITESQPRALHFSNVRASVIVPFLSERKPAGLLVVDVYTTARPWDANVQTALAKVARVIGANGSDSRKKRSLPCSPPNSFPPPSMRSRRRPNVSPDPAAATSIWRSHKPSTSATNTRAAIRTPLPIME